MELRRLVSKDLMAYMKSRLFALKESPSAFLVTWEEEAQRGTAHFEATLSHEGADRAIFAAIVDDEVVGTVGVFQENRVKTRHKAVIWGMYVSPKYRRQGLGGKLVDMAVSFARDEIKAGAVFLSVETANESAKKLYRSKGFQHWGTEPRAFMVEGKYLSDDHMALLF
jgi:RimJ/RimL family protein N-acetyltransferase